VEDESKRSGQKAMRRESRGEEGLVSCCGDGDVVDVDEGDGGGFGEGRKGEKDGVLDANLQMRQKKVLFHACSVWVTLSYNGDHISRSSLNGLLFQSGFKNRPREIERGTYIWASVEEVEVDAGPIDAGPEA